MCERERERLYTQICNFANLHLRFYMSLHVKARAIPHHSVFSVQKWSIITQFRKVTYFLHKEIHSTSTSSDVISERDEKSILFQFYVNLIRLIFFWGGKTRSTPHYLMLENHSFLYHLYLSLNLEALINLRLYCLVRKIANPCEIIQYEISFYVPKFRAI